MFVVVVLVFYGPSTLFRSFRARSVYLSTLFLGSLPVLSAHSLASNWPLPFLNQRKGENGRRNYFMTNLHERMLPDVRIEPATVRIPGGRAHDRATAPGKFNVCRNKVLTKNANWEPLTRRGSSKQELIDVIYVFENRHCLAFTFPLLQKK